jgi:hypothetical protein
VIYRLAMAFILSFVLVGAASAAITEDFAYIYNMDQSVEGNGFFAAYKDIDAGDLVLDSKGHGSGSYSYDSKMRNELGYTFDSAAQDYSSTSDRKIVFNESVDYAYGPSRLLLGKSFRSGAFLSLGKEVICIKNYDTGVSMNARFDSLDTMSKDISAELYSKEIYTDDDPYSLADDLSGKTVLNIDAAFTGRGHIGALEVGNSEKNILNMIDEDYIGTFSLVKKISHTSNFRRTQESEDWLPCCYGGWSDMNYRDQKGFGKSAKGVFDCTCFVPPKSIPA